MDALKAEIAKVGRQIDKAESDGNTAVAQGRAEDARRLRRKEEQLQRTEEQLLREEILIALEASGKQYCLKRTVLDPTGTALSTKIKLALSSEAI
ncbi:hypothetical protein WJX84_005408 [Apatococcus fuscideae]|uniref:Uncharacterized protein n=1 Tax=Apatococcus fuscideae TaxID=2026836 RepID=A0AAW1SSL8_9CHLO